MSLDAVLLPSHSGGFVQQEECCWTWNGRATPMLALHAATGYGAPLVPFPLDSDGREWAGRRVAMVFSWVFGEQLESAARRIAAQAESLWLIPNPLCTQHALAERFADAPNVAVTMSSPFSAAAPLRLDAVADWTAFDAVVYQLTSGCTHGCAFCPWGGQRFAVRAGWLAFAEIEALMDRVPPARTRRPAVWFLVNEMTGRPYYLDQVFSFMHARSLTWSGDANCRNGDREQWETIRGSGCVRLTLGIEFLDDQMLDDLGKGHTVEKALADMADLTELGVPFHFSLRQGVGEDEAALARQRANLEEAVRRGIRPDHVVIGSMAEWPGREWLAAGTARVNLGSKAYPRWTQQLSPAVAAAWKDTSAFLAASGWAVRG